MRRAALLIIGVVVSVSCKTTRNISDIKADNDRNHAIKTAELPCYGDRKFTAVDHLGFDFHASNAHLGNAYWLAVSSSAVYGTSQLNETLIKDWGKSSLVEFHFFGEDPTDVGAKGFIAEFDQGVIITFRGTNDSSDLLTNLDRAKFRGKAFNRSGKFEDLQIHRGFWLATESPWDLIFKTLQKNTPTVDLPVTSDEAFVQVNRIFRSIMQEADIEGFSPNVLFTAEIKGLQERGIIRADARMPELLGVLNIWAEEAKIASTAYAASIKNKNPKLYTDAVKKGMLRKKNNFPRVHQFFNYRTYKPIWLTGHSLGGALSTVFTYRLMKHGIPVQGLVTFGSPRSGNDIYEFFFESSWQEDGKMLNLMRFQNDNDGVTRVPHINGWRHIGDPWFINQNNQLYVPIPPPEKKTALDKQLILYPVGQDATFYADELPPNYKGIWTFDLLEFVGDHAMSTQYIPHMEQFVFGKKANGCR
jgi:hypothetical protein